ncbi:MAG: hypothetical protein JWP69_1605 [Flaviaesturariibacter sp.]|nr:hypothetical protein [Flaviaesturariibacter sp.]
MRYIAVCCTRLLEQINSCCHAELYGAVYAAFGKKSALLAIEKPAKLINLYNSAIKKKHIQCLLLPSWIVDKFNSMDK